MRRTDPWEDTGLYPQVAHVPQYPNDPDQPKPEGLRFAGQERPWVSPGPPPGQRNSQRPSGLLIWIGVALILLAAGALCAIGIATSDTTEPELGPEGPVVAARVEATGECRTNIVGRYSVLATVTVHNATSTEQRGTVWARWPITGAEPLVYAEEWTLKPGETKTLHVDKPVDAERWYRLKACDHGWSSTGVPSP
jgi:hypothetical protein